MEKILYLFSILFLISINGYSQKDRLDEIAVSQSWSENFLGTIVEEKLNSEYVDETYDLSIYLPPSWICVYDVCLCQFCIGYPFRETAL